MYEYFGTFSRCFLSMFELALANWPTPTRILTEELSEWFILICLCHKLTIGFAVVGVINGVILQETFKVAGSDDVIMMRQKQKEVKMIQDKMRSLLQALDHSKDGELDLAEFEIISNHPDVGLWLASMGIETNDLETLFNLLDANNNGSVSEEELLKRVPRLRGFARSIDVLALRAKIEGATPAPLTTEHFSEGDAKQLGL